MGAHGSTDVHGADKLEVALGALYEVGLRSHIVRPRKRQKAMFRVGDRGYGEGAAAESGRRDRGHSDS